MFNYSTEGTTQKYDLREAWGATLEAACLTSQCVFQLHRAPRHNLSLSLVFANAVP